MGMPFPMLMSVMPMAMFVRWSLANLFQMFLNFCLIKFVSITLNYFDRILRALPKTGAKPITKVVRRKHSLAVYHLYRPFST
jgi:hypothetical protein